jgi:hypothetical protein
VTLEGVAPGRHALALTTDDGRRVQQEVEVAAGARVERDVTAFPGFGSLSVTSDVWYEVSVDGGPKQQTPLFLSRIAAGRHTVRASRPGYRERNYEIDVKEDDTYRLTVSLEKEN